MQIELKDWKIAILWPHTPIISQKQDHYAVQSDSFFYWLTLYSSLLHNVFHTILMRWFTIETNCNNIQGFIHSSLSHLSQHSSWWNNMGGKWGFFFFFVYCSVYWCRSCWTFSQQSVSIETAQQDKKIPSITMSCSNQSSHSAHNLWSHM